MARRAFLTLLILAAGAVEARVISYAPYTDRSAVPAVQSRFNRHFVLIEQLSGSAGGAIPEPLPPVFTAGPAQLVLYDSSGIEEPRVIYPQDGSSAPVFGLESSSET